jgi:hypothetical protein
MYFVSARRSYDIKHFVLRFEVLVAMKMMMLGVVMPHGP